MREGNRQIGTLRIQLLPEALVVAPEMPPKDGGLALAALAANGEGKTSRQRSHCLRFMFIVFHELQQMRWHDFWWRRVTSFWSALVEADAGSLHSMIFHDAIQLALAGCKFSWAAQVFKCFSTLGEPLPLIADAPITIDINLLQEHFMRDRLASFDSLPQDPRLAPSAGVKLCT